MELAQRAGADRFLVSGRYQQMEASLRGQSAMSAVRSLIVSTFDRRTRMLPFMYYDWYLSPCGPRSISGALRAAGMTKTRLVFQLWTPRILPSRAVIDGERLDILGVSSMQIHSAPAYRLIEDAWRMESHRPLIVAGGPKACYEPFDFFGLGANGQIGADVVVTGEEAVFLELLEVLAAFGGGPGRMREAFERARAAGALHEVPGLVFSLDGRHDGRHLHNTGPQRLLQDLDVLPLASEGFATLEPRHGRETLSSRPMPLDTACRGLMVATLLVTRGCKFHCHYCPIPAYNQRTIRQKSPDRMAAEFLDCVETMGTRTFFGADDNFFNNRAVAQGILEAVASTQYEGRSLGKRIRFMTESTVIDTYKNRDLLPLARRAGMSNLWIGVEDLSARLINKGQTPGLTEDLFEAMLSSRIAPRVMLMHHDDQPLRDRERLVGLIDQIRFLFKAGAMGMQCTVASPSLGSRWADEVIGGGQLYERVRGQEVDDACFDGNHVVASTRRDAWRIQLNLVRGYAAFYNPLNLARAMLAGRQSLGAKRIVEQIRGSLALGWMAWRLKGYLWGLWRGPIERKRDWDARFRRSGSPYPGLVAEDEQAGEAAEQASPAEPAVRARRQTVASRGS